ncbi:hypothetical protein FCM35_KLT07976 [Carex littledalei]|uniref:Uncharacterized protein n=1 Tax=Carex littledalei TaxID=544730 RepID=A0A833QX18_9POAL|nr:hypothetical protein FCM35_KLT07976 [Carex littledalei]
MQDSACTLQRTVQTKDRELTLLTEKLSAHISLFNSVQKEANSAKRAFDVIKRTLNEKEQVVAGLNDKINRICTIEKDFVETIKLLEGKEMQHELHSMEVILQKFEEIFNVLKTEKKKDASSWSREMECNDCLENHVVAINSKLDNKEDNIELIGDDSAQTDTPNLPELKHHVDLSLAGATGEGNSQQEVR